MVTSVIRLGQHAYCRLKPFCLNNRDLITEGSFFDFIDIKSHSIYCRNRICSINMTATVKRSWSFEVPALSSRQIKELSHTHSFMVCDRVNTDIGKRSDKQKNTSSFF